MSLPTAEARAAFGAGDCLPRRWRAKALVPVEWFVQAFTWAEALEKATRDKPIRPENGVGIGFYEVELSEVQTAEAEEQKE